VEHRASASLRAPPKQSKGHKKDWICFVAMTVAGESVPLAADGSHYHFTISCGVAHSRED
jgi:hypothetical protein